MNYSPPESHLSVSAPSGQLPRVGPQNPFLPFSKEEVNQSIPERFEKQVEKYGDRLAVKDGDRSITYSQLEKETNRVARAISKQVQGAEAVALLLETGIDAVVSILAILKAGCFYVPLDPSYPPSRNRYMLEDSEARVLVTNGSYLPLVGQLGTDGTLQILDIDTIEPSSPDEELRLPISPDDLAHILYTSGSTGKPKGVIQTHRNLLHYTLKITNGLHISPEDRLILLASSCYTAFSSVLFGSLLNGAGLFPLNLTTKADKIPELLKQERITIYQSVPTLFRHVVSMFDGTESLDALRMIKLAGEPVLKQDVELYRKHFPDHTMLHNGLGATEINVIRQFFIDKQMRIDDSLVPVGYPVDDTKVLILDEHRRPLGPNQVGEIAIRSPYLSPGYWRKPELTAAAFLPDPDGGNNRIYLSGDVGYLLPDGCLVHLGRKDFQVKIHGHRVETAEVETALLNTPGIDEAVVTAREDAIGEKRLLAYLVRKAHDCPSSQVLRQRLKSQLPDFMIPSRFVFLEAMPLTPNGKIDRLALPEPTPEIITTEKGFVAPRDELEMELSRIWEHLLKIQSIGIDQDFFDLGGDSLLAATMSIEIEKQLAVRLPLDILFDSPTVAKLAQAVRREGRPIGNCLVPIQPAGSKPPLYCIHGLGGHVAHYRNLANHLDRDQPVYALQPRAIRTGSSPCYTVEEMASHYVENIRLLQPEGPYYLVGFSAGGVFAFEVAQQLYAQGHEVGLLAMLDTGCPGYAQLLPALERARRHLQKMAGLGPRQKLHYALARLATIGERKAVRSWELLHRIWKRTGLPIQRTINTVDRAIRIALTNYRPQPYPGRITLFAAVPGEELFPHFDRDPRMGWAALAKHGLERHEIPGTHTSIVSKPGVVVLARKLQCSLSIPVLNDRAQQQPSSERVDIALARQPGTV